MAHVHQLPPGEEGDFLKSTKAMWQGMTASYFLFRKKNNVLPQKCVYIDGS
jgi:hypothetical protein